MRTAVTDTVEALSPLLSSVQLCRAAEPHIALPASPHTEALVSPLSSHGSAWKWEWRPQRSKSLNQWGVGASLLRSAEAVLNYLLPGLRPWCSHQSPHQWSTLNTFSSFHISVPPASLLPPKYIKYTSCTKSSGVAFGRTQSKTTAEWMEWIQILGERGSKVLERCRNHASALREPWATPGNKAKWEVLRKKGLHLRKAWLERVWTGRGIH